MVLIIIHIYRSFHSFGLDIVYELYKDFLMNIENRIGPRTDPCGTSSSTSWVTESTTLILTHMERFERYWFIKRTADSEK